MDVKLEETIKKFINETYSLTKETLSDYKITIKCSNSRVPIIRIYEDVVTAFNVSHFDSVEQFNKWFDSAALKLNNDMISGLYDGYKHKDLVIF